jgi:hypothetical protein
MVVIPRIYELICSFKEECHSRGWKASENEDWIRINNEFHNFLWALIGLTKPKAKSSKSLKISWQENGK